jgi:hypothetical protein
MSTSLAQDPRHRRRTTGCLTCRRRRVKCDEVRPSCRQCIRMERVCSWQGDRIDIVRAERTEVIEAGILGEHTGGFGPQAASLNIFEAETEGNDHLPKRHEPVRAGESLRVTPHLFCRPKYRSSINSTSVTMSLSKDIYPVENSDSRSAQSAEQTESDAHKTGRPASDV